MINGTNNVKTIGVLPEEMDFVQEKFALNGNVFDCTEQFEDILATCSDIVIIVQERATVEVINEIEDFRREVGTDDDTRYYIFSEEQWKEALSTYRREKSLMERWRQCWSKYHSEYSSFNADGIVDYGRYFTMPKGKKTLIILKETNGLSNSLSEFLFTGGSNTYYRTWNNVARWIKMILSDEYMESVNRVTLNDLVHDFAVMNVKKYAGCARANKQEVRKIAEADKELLLEQIQLYNPDIILTGGFNLISDFVHDELLEEPRNTWIEPKKSTDPPLWYYWTNKVAENKKTLVVSMPHPNRSEKERAIQLQQILKKELGV